MLIDPFKMKTFHFEDYFAFKISRLFWGGVGVKREIKQGLEHRLHELHFHFYTKLSYQTTSYFTFLKKQS